MTNYVTTATNLGLNTIQDRLDWLLSEGYKSTVASSTSMDEYLSMQPSNSLIWSDLAGDTATISQIYAVFYKDDVQRLAGLYANLKYPNASSTPLDSYKKDIIIGYFDGPLDGRIISTLEAQPTQLMRLFPLRDASGKVEVTGNILATETLLNAFGFSDWLAEQDTTSLMPNQISGLAGLAAVQTGNQAELETLKRAVRAVKGLPPPAELTTEDERNVNQCALISDLLHKGISYKAYPQAWHRGKDSSNKCFHGRIYPVTLDDFNPDSLINMCTIPRTIKSFFNLPDPKVNAVFWDLYWVYMDSEGLKEEKIFRTNKGKEAGSTFVDKLRELKNANFLNAGTTVSSITTNVDTERKGYTIKNIDIVYEGTNPSTARNDVKVTVKIKLDSLLALKSPCCYVALKTDTDDDGKPDISERVEIKIADLVGGPQSNTYETQVIATTNFSREFVPDSSRIRLKVFTNEDVLSGTDLLINLATIDHTLSTPSSEGTVEMTITYRGYFEQAMNMPYNDALADGLPGGLIDARLARNKKIKEAKSKKCSSKLIREIARINQEQERLEVEDFHKKGGLVKRINDSGIIHEYSIDQIKLAEGLNGNILDPRHNYVTGMQHRGPIATHDIYAPQLRTWMVLSSVQLAVAGGIASGLLDDDTGYAEATDETISYRINQSYAGRFFFLGDLMDILLDCLYKPGTAEHRKHATGMNLRFIMGTVRVPDPNDLDNFMTINPLQIPIDLPFFVSWYHDTIVKKGITHYPVGAFIKDLLERLVNDVIYDTCFSILLPDEQPPQLRTTFFTDCDSQDRWFKTSTSTSKFSKRPGTWFDPLDPYSSSPIRRRSNKPNILMKKDASVDIARCKNYCVIYQQSPSYFRQLKAQKKFSLKKDPYCPTMYYGYNMKNLNYLQGVTLTRSDSKYLKEARFFSSQLGNLSLMSNIYDVSFEIAEKKINTMLYPGNIINLIITDFEGGSDTKFIDFSKIVGKLDESDPHKKGTLANTLGIGGYHIIKSVTYTLDGKPSKNIKVAVATKFTGTDAVGDQERDSAKTPFANEQATCITQYNAALGSLRTTEDATDTQAADFDRIYEAGTADDPKAGSTTSSTQTTRSTEVAAPLPANNPAVKAANAELAQKQADEEAAALAAGLTPTAAIEKTYNYAQAKQFTTKTYKKGSTFSTALFKDKYLHVKSKTVDTNNKTFTIEWEVGTFSGSDFAADNGPPITIVYKQ